MSFLNSISDWFNKTILQNTYNPVADELSQIYRNNFSQNLNALQTTVTNLGGGLGNTITSIPGVGPATKTALSALQTESQNLLSQAKSMTPNQIAAANDSLNQKYQDLLTQAKQEGTTPPKSNIEQAEVSISSFFSSIFSNILYICLFVFILTLAFLGSSLAANIAYSNVKTRATPYILYYMVYGFLLFPLSILLGIGKFMTGTLKIYAVLAPLHKGWFSNPILNLLIFLV